MIRCLGLTLLLCLAGPAVAQGSWSEWIAEFRSEALSKGIEAAVFDAAFKELRLTEAALHEEAGGQHGKPGRHKDADGLGAHAMIPDGRKHARIHRDLLERIAKDFYRKELLAALKILQERHVELADFLGNSVGATGQTQFMPSSWVAYAVDYNGDGRRDIWRTTPDVLASIANFQHKMGWRPAEPWAVEVSLPADFEGRLEGLKVSKSVDAWHGLGVAAVSGRAFPDPDLEGSIVRLKDGPVYLALHNFRVIMRYNDSIRYAAAVGKLADGICEPGEPAN